MFSEEIFVLQISKGVNSDSTLYRLQKGNVLQFRLDSNLFGHNVRLSTNHPQNEKSKFIRSEFKEINWNNDNFDDSTFVNLKIISSGSFQFRYTSDRVLSGSGYFLVDPELKIRNEKLKMDSINMVTVLPKSLGNFQDWKPRLEVSFKSGYNFIHFAPVQELGLSNSSYSIKDQLKLNPIFGPEANLEELKKLIDWMANEWGILSICDLVLNHTANETPWLMTNSECGYNLTNTPHLRPSFLLDSLLENVGIEVGQNLLVDRGIPAEINSEDHLRCLKIVLLERIFELKLHEFWQCNVNEIVEKFQKMISQKKSVQEEQQKVPFPEPLELISEEFSRLNTKIDFELAFAIFNDRSEHLRSKLIELNFKTEELIRNHLNAAIDNVLAGIRYERIQVDGPRLKIVDHKNPLTHSYFINLKKNAKDLYSNEMEEKISFTCADHILAHNGWVMNDDPLRNFANKDSNIYLRRELIVWGDSVKLRFGENSQSCPFLWNLMKEYTQSVAHIFHGIRLDNCHSTPLHVAEYLIDSAREVREDLYLIAELFTNSDATDNIFVNRLGISSLIRECLSAWDSHEQGRLIYRYGGNPVGAFKIVDNMRILTPTIAHAILFEQTHDNPSPIEKRSVYDMLPLSSLASFGSCGFGSSRGYDEFVPNHIHVVNEKRFYKSWSNEETIGKYDPNCFINIHTGIMKVKKILNDIHSHMGQSEFSEVFVDQIDPDITSVTRHNPNTHDTLVLVSYTAFKNPPEMFQRFNQKDMKIEGNIDRILFESSVQLSEEITYTPISKEFKMNPSFINGLENVNLYLEENLLIQNSKFVDIEMNENASFIKFKNFQPGSIVCFKISPTKSTMYAFAQLKETFHKDKIQNLLEKLTLADLNVILFRCKEEEESDELGFSSYEIPNFGHLKYCGLQGIMSVLSKIRTNNDLGHPLCGNLRDGDWLMDYLCNRLIVHENTKEFGEYLKDCFSAIKLLPRYLIPTYFDFVFTKVYESCLNQSFALMNEFVSNGAHFTKLLSMTSIICSGFCKNAKMPNASISLSAGLPHFSTGYMRNWGRDTFISLPGLFIITGRYQEAKQIILSYASVVRHGLIPNLLDKGLDARFNCRDSTWFWLQSIKKYIENCPNNEGESILKEKIGRIWPDDNCKPNLNLSLNDINRPCPYWPFLYKENYSKVKIFQILKVIYFKKVQTLEDIVQEVLQRHFEGIHFIERNAGLKIDAHMKSEGFSIDIVVDEETGFIHGGNRYNCGTWMDKMGSSEKAGNKGLPATPRDGCAIEILGLSSSFISFLSQMYKSGKYPYEGVRKVDFEGNDIIWTYEQWNQRILENFEKYFWIDDETSSSDPKSKFINRKFIIKDTHGSSLVYTDYQLRPNFPIALAVAPNLLSPSKIKLALDTYEECLLSKFGVKTLDEKDWNYRGFYDNSNDSIDPTIAHGFNYHNGPEWIWPVGFYLLARLENAKQLVEIEGKQILLKTISHIKKVLAPFHKHLANGDWKGIPELTNKDGEYCPGSCEVQAWSAATLLEVQRNLHDLELEMDSKKPN